MSSLLLIEEQKSGADMRLRAKSAACVAVASMLLFSLFPFQVASASADPSAAIDITNKCVFKPSSAKGTFRKALDKNLRSYWTSSAKGEPYIDITIPDAYSAGALYFHWGMDMPPQWKLYAIQGGVSTQVLEGGSDGYLTDYEAIPPVYASCKTFRLQAAVDNINLCISKIAVYTPGDPPYYAPHWQPFSGRADLLVVATHPDDEQLYLGPVAPTYIDQGKKVITMFTDFAARRRRLEAEEAVWSSGVRTYPVVDNDKQFSLDYLVQYIVEEIRKYKPAVVVTQDIKGEYGHAKHKRTCHAAQIAFREAGDPSYFPESAAKYGVWNPAKLYIHLYQTQQLVLDITKPLEAYGGETALQVVQNAYLRHVSQHNSRKLPVKGKYDFRKYGLFDTRVGPDMLHDSMFENITEDTMLSLNPQYKP